MHHLSPEKHKGFMLRGTLQVGSKVVGKRKKFPLYTKDPEQALYGKKVVLGVLRVLGVKIADRKQKPVKRHE
ncbi:hypothetical protein OJ996_09005 [Luteolibacter sp. GHJ8]|uniref:Uncharacterized protein n=1 Tax=Luteolibacter rhizosphaerae TaxID=2989719 RepID=A0ABT3G2G5_9BACT|nr:hypothetical protein [Luteolibacter rhizosphaerae]MCW1913711.1 hypothetical protein [Luteolibacter rhizosphaerae]